MKVQRVSTPKTALLEPFLTVLPHLVGGVPTAMAIFSSLTSMRDSLVLTVLDHYLLQAPSSRVCASSPVLIRAPGPFQRLSLFSSLASVRDSLDLTVLYHYLLQAPPSRVCASSPVLIRAPGPFQRRALDIVPSWHHLSPRSNDHSPQDGLRSTQTRIYPCEVMLQRV
jgi:hypothetical protein